MVFKCSECGKIFWQISKGCKLKPKPLCPKCVLGNEKLVCKNGLCRNKFKRKNGWLDECWTCQLPLCHKCAKKTITVKGVEFSFCEKHYKINMEKLIEDANELNEWEKE